MITELRKVRDALHDRKGENLDVDEKKLKDAHALQEFKSYRKVK